MPEHNIIIVGGGAAGLTTAGALKHLGLDSVILDKDTEVGGTWARRYARLHLHSVRAYSSLAHYPLPRTWPKWVPKEQFVRYLKAYAAHFHLNWIGNTIVRCIRRSDNSGWLIETDREVWRSNIVVIAAGHYGTAIIPDWPGCGDYTGQLLHSIDYRTGRVFAGKRVLVVGSGNSGTEIACDLAEQGAAFVANSIRTPPPVAPREFLGTPVQVFGIVMSALPVSIADRIGRVIARVALGDLSSYGVRPAAWQPFSASKVPIIDVGWVTEVKKGNVQLRPGVARLTATGVIYDNEQAEDFGAIVAATGFKTGLPDLINVSDLLDERGYPRYHSGQPTSAHGFYFIGYTESVRGHLFEANRDSRRLARLIQRQLQLQH
ncbi:MAG TPA: NAD(P)/FAD-dependent oxidoreductase [Anaerolineae bacterium]|nr:NAD(P)/FAD-dependent oxidoreductase [Anaerolineae bacterium]